MFKAHQIMSRDPITISPETRVLDAMRMLVEEKITGLPVVESDGKVAGVLSEKDLLRLAYEATTDGTVAAFMTRNPVCFQQDDDVVEIAECLIENPFRRVLILDGDRLVGVVSRRDVIRFILKFRGAES